MPEMPSRRELGRCVLCGDALLCRGMRLPASSLNSRMSCDALLVVDGGDHVGVADVVDPGNVLVADAFDAVIAEAAAQKRRALQCFGGDDADVRVLRAEEIAGGDRAGAAGGADVSATRRSPGCLMRLKISSIDSAGHVVVPDGVAELFELVEDHAVFAVAS